MIFRVILPWDGVTKAWTLAVQGPAVELTAHLWEETSFKGNRTIPTLKYG